MSAARSGLSLALLCAAAAGVPEIGTNQRLDVALHIDDTRPPDVVAGRIVAVRPGNEEALEQAVLGIDLKVRSAVLGPRELEGRTLAVDTSAFEWPSGLVRPEVGASCILVLRRDETEGGALDLLTVVPARDQAIGPAADREAVKRLLAREILAALAVERDPGRQRRLTLLAAPILTAEEATALEPYLGSGDAWLRRAALAGLVHATRRPGYVELAALDIRRFLETTGPRDDIKDFESPGSSWAPYPFLLDHYFFLDNSWGDEAGAQDFLPLWRLIAVRMEGYEWMRFHYGVEPLCAVGTEADLAFLREYHTALVRGEGALKEVAERPHVRQRVLLGLARILGLDLPSYVTDDFVVHEAEQARQVAKALEARDAARR